MRGGPFQRTWARDRATVAFLAVASALTALAWRGITRPMVDTVGYRETVDSLEQGWAWVTDRTVGYPLVMMATGAGSGSSRFLFLAQLAMHVTTVVLMLDVARRHGVGRWAGWRWPSCCSRRWCSCGWCTRAPKRCPPSS